MADLIDRVCEHARLYCPEGCHDVIAYREENPGVECMLEIIEYVANEDVPEFEARLDERSGKDGLEETTELAMVLMLERT